MDEQTSRYTRCAWDMFKNAYWTSTFVVKHKIARILQEKCVLVRLLQFLPSLLTETCSLRNFGYEIEYVFSPDGFGNSTLLYGLRLVPFGFRILTHDSGNAVLQSDLIDRLTFAWLKDSADLNINYNQIWRCKSELRVAVSRYAPCPVAHGTQLQVKGESYRICTRKAQSLHLKDGKPPRWPNREKCFFLNQMYVLNHIF